LSFHDSKSQEKVAEFNCRRPVGTLDGIVCHKMWWIPAV